MIIIMIYPIQPLERSRNGPTLITFAGESRYVSVCGGVWEGQPHFTQSRAIIIIANRSSLFAHVLLDIALDTQEFIG